MCLNVKIFSQVHTFASSQNKIMNKSYLQDNKTFRHRSSEIENNKRLITCAIEEADGRFARELQRIIVRIMSHAKSGKEALCN